MQSRWPSPIWCPSSVATVACARRGVPAAGVPLDLAERPERLRVLQLFTAGPGIAGDFLEEEASFVELAHSHEPTCQPSPRAAEVLEPEGQ